MALSDHVIPETAAFHTAIKIGIDQVQLGKIVTFWISPTRPETGYGYLELAEDKFDSVGTSSVVQFVEKLEHSIAERML